jgi:peptidoglycan LD-endopeptidase CwlK
MRCILECAGASTMASYVRTEWAGLGPHVTEHLPGSSWHQWGEAADVFVLVGGRAIWDGSLVKPVADIAEEEGLYHSYKMKRWEPKRRHWHVQLRKEESPLLIRGFCDSWKDVEMAMLERFEVKFPN